MNEDQTKDAIRVMQAWLDGKAIEYFNPLYGKWSDISADGDPVWDWNALKYRIKRAPREIWLVEYGNRGFKVCLTQDEYESSKPEPWDDARVSKFIEESE